MIYIIWSSVLCFSANTGTKQKTSYITLNTCKVFPGTIFKYLQGLTSSYTIYFNFFHYTVKSMLLSWLTHAHGYVHGYVRACSYMFMHVKFWLPYLFASCECHNDFLFHVIASYESLCLRKVIDNLRK